MRPGASMREMSCHWPEGTAGGAGTSLSPYKIAGVRGAKSPGGAIGASWFAPLVRLPGGSG